MKQDNKEHTSPMTCGSAMGAEGHESLRDALKTILAKYFICEVKTICEVNEHHYAPYTIPEEFEEHILM